LYVCSFLKKKNKQTNRLDEEGVGELN